MKNIYAIDSTTSEPTQKLAEEYSEALKHLSDNVITLGDTLKLIAETNAKAVLKLEDDDWDIVLASISKPAERKLCGQLFWSANDASILHQALATEAQVTQVQMLASWLETQTLRKRSMVLLWE